MQKQLCPFLPSIRTRRRYFFLLKPEEMSQKAVFKLDGDDYPESAFCAIAEKPLVLATFRGMLIREYPRSVAAEEAKKKIHQLDCSKKKVSFSI
jgi:hypothetical protein